MNLVGSLLGAHSVVSTSQSSRFPHALKLCEEACFDEFGCVGYSVGAYVPNTGFKNCFLYANVTELMPNPAFQSGVLRSVL